MIKQMIYEWQQREGLNLIPLREGKNKEKEGGLIKSTLRKEEG